MKKYSIFSIFFLTAAFSSAVLFAQGFNGPGAVNQAQNQNGFGYNGPVVGAVAAQATTVGRLNTLPNNAAVILTGTIVNSLGRSYYTFRDTSGEIIVEIERKAWGMVTIGPNDRVEITGKAEWKRDGTIQIEVKTLRRL